MEFYTLASGSSGNCTLIRGQNASILVDAGISCRKITSRLRSVGVELADVDGIFITHTHSDHICGLKVLLKQYTGRIYASAGAGEDLLSRVETLRPDQLSVLIPEQPVEVSALEVTGFSTPHDAPGSMGYHIREGSRRFAIATDLGCIQPNIVSMISGVHAAILEANHDPDWLREGPYPYQLQQRILGMYGHLSNEVCGELAVELVRSGAGVLVLGHLSRENNAPERAYDVVADYLATAGLEEQVRLLVAPRDDIGGPYPV